MGMTTLLLAGGLLASPRIDSAAPVARIPLNVLFAPARWVNPKLSPDGQQLAYIAPDRNVQALWIRSVKGGDDRMVVRDSANGVQDFRWSGDGRQLLFLRDQAGNRRYRLYGADLAGGMVRDYTPYDNVQVQLLGRPARAGHLIVFAMNREDVRRFDVYALDTRTGKVRMTLRNPGDHGDPSGVAAQTWAMDHQGVVRTAIAGTEDGGVILRVRDGAEGAWRDIGRWTIFEGTPDVWSVSTDGKRLLLRDNRNANTNRLVWLDLATMRTTVAASDSTYDVEDVDLDPATGVLRAVAIYRARREWQALTPEGQRDVDGITRACAGDAQVISQDGLDAHWIIRCVRDDGPPAYYLLNRQSGQSSLLFVDRPELTTYRLAKMEPIVYAARDGLTIHGYLTFPPGQPRSRLPTVMLVHGGPWGRDTWGYKNDVQWLANRGYLVVQVNFRGSTGYGQAFRNAGFRELGGKMQDDVTDALAWVVKQGYADAARVAIMGGSYGGYAALVGASFTPTLYRAAISIVGMSNWNTLLRNALPMLTTSMPFYYAYVGNPDKDSVFLASRSPLMRADSIRIPMLIVHGANDPLVPMSESRQIAAALERRGIPHEFILFPDEGHGLQRLPNRLRFYGTAETFLAKHLQGKP